MSPLGFVDLIQHGVCFTKKMQVRLCVTDLDNGMLEGALLAGVSPLRCQ